MLKLCLGKTQQLIIQLGLLFSFSFYCGIAFANEVRISLPEDKFSASTKKSVVGRPRDNLRFIAELYKVVDGEEDGNLEAQVRSPKEFSWRVICSGWQARHGCSEGGFVYDKEGVSFVVPDFLLEDEVLEIEVKHESDALPAFLKIKNPDPNAEAVALEPEGVKKDPKRQSGVRARIEDRSRESPREPERKNLRSGNPGRNSGEEVAPTSHNRRGGGSFSGRSASRSEERSSESKKSKSKRDTYDRDSEERAFSDYFSSGGSSSYSGGGNGNPSGARGYNRDNSTPVVACSQQIKSGGGYSLSCAEAGVKVLRVKKMPKSGEAPVSNLVKIRGKSTGTRKPLRVKSFKKVEKALLN